MIAFKSSLYLKELLSLTVMRLSGDTLRCSLGQAKHGGGSFHTHVQKVPFTPSQPVGQLRGLYLPPASSRAKQGCLWEEKEQNIPRCLQGSSGLLRLCLPMGWQVSWISVLLGEDLCPAPPSCVTANRARNILAAASPICTCCAANTYW